MPAFLSIEKLTSKYTATVNGQPVTMTGEKVYSPGRAGNLSLPIPDATAPSAVSSVDSVVVSKLELGMAVRAFGSLSQASMICVPAVHTTVALAVTAGADTASLTATVTPSTATGKVDFYEGSAKVGTTQALASGTASVNLTGVSAGSHSYTAKYIPTDGSAFVASVSAAETVTVGVSEPLTQTADLQCTYTSYGSNYTGTITTSVADRSLKTVADDVQPFGMPAFLSIEKLTTEYTATVNGQPVTMTGEKVYSPGRAGNLSLPIPDATAPSAVSSVDSVVVSKLELGMAVRAFGSLSQASMISVPAVHTTVASGGYSWRRYLLR